MNEYDLQKGYSHPFISGEAKLYTDQRFVFIDNGSMRGNHWVVLLIKTNKPYYFYSFGGPPDKFLLQQLPKPKFYK